MFYIFSFHEMDILRNNIKISPNEDIFEIMKKLDSLNLTIKDYLDSLSKDKVLEANSFDLVGENHIITKFEDKIKDNYINFNYKFNAFNQELNLLNTNHYLVISKNKLNSLKKIPFVVKYFNESNNCIEEKILLHCYKAEYNKIDNTFTIQSKCWFNEYFNYFDLNHVDNSNLSLFLRSSLSFNSNTLSSSYNKDINDFYATKILELNDYIALTSYCRNANKDILELISKYKQEHNEVEYISFLANLLKYNIGSKYSNDCFEAKFTFNLITRILLEDESVLKECLKSVYTVDYLYTIKKTVKFFKEIFEEEKILYEKELKEDNKKTKKKASSNKTSKVKKNESSFEIGYELSKEYLEKIINFIIELHDELKYDDSEIEYFSNILEVFKTENKEIENSEDKNEIKDNVVVEVIESKSNENNSNEKEKKEDLTNEQSSFLDIISKEESNNENQLSFI